MATAAVRDSHLGGERVSARAWRSSELAANEHYCNRMCANAMYIGCRCKCVPSLKCVVKVLAYVCVLALPIRDAAGDGPKLSMLGTRANLSDIRDSVIANESDFLR